MMAFLNGVLCQFSPQGSEDDDFRNTSFLYHFRGAGFYDLFVFLCQICPEKMYSIFYFVFFSYFHTVHKFPYVFCLSGTQKQKILDWRQSEHEISQTIYIKIAWWSRHLTLIFDLLLIFLSLLFSLHPLRGYP